MIWLGIVLFFGLHLIPMLPGIRSRLIGRFGENRYKGLFSLLSLTGLILIGTGYVHMGYRELWTPPVWAGHLALTVMPIVFILWTAAEVKGHIRKNIKHPMIIGVILWALVHLANNGDRASLYLFGSFALFSVFSLISSIRRSKVPEYADAKVSHDAAAVGIGLVLFTVLLLWGHEFLFGVTPFYWES